MRTGERDRERRASGERATPLLGLLAQRSSTTGATVSVATGAVHSVGREFTKKAEKGKKSIQRMAMMMSGVERLVELSRGRGKAKLSERREIVRGERIKAGERRRERDGVTDLR